MMCPIESDRSRASALAWIKGRRSVRSASRAGCWHVGLVAILVGTVADPADPARSADRRELRRPPGPDGDGRPQPRAGLRASCGPSSTPRPSRTTSSVEPPVYQLLAVALQRATGWTLEAAGRFVSAVAMGLGAWGLFGLVRRRDGDATAFAAVAALALFPVTIRYGRAFQPDALDARRRCWRRAEVLGSGGQRPSSVVADPGLAACWRSAWPARSSLASCLVPLALVVLRPRTMARKCCSWARRSCPCCLWYSLGRSPGRLGKRLAGRGRTTRRSGWRSLASRDWPSRQTLASHRALLHGPGVHAPRAGPGDLGTFSRGRSEPGANRPLVGLGPGGLVTLAFLAEKLHHEYYWLSLAPGRGRGHRPGPRRAWRCRHRGWRAAVGCRASSS